MELDCTIWRDVKLEHPVDWELFRMNRKDDRWRCCFADRYHQRLDLRWRRLKYVPDLNKMLERHHEKEKADKTTVLQGQPEGWLGTVRQTEGGWIVNAGKFFENAKLLVEIVVVWPGKRDRSLENRILQGIRPAESESGLKLWKAMGMRVRLSEQYDIIEFKAEAGRVEWIFGKERKRGPRVAIERIAMPKYWLRGTLDKWLMSQSGEWKIMSRSKEVINGHEAAVQKAQTRGLLVDSLVLKRKVKVEKAWLCEKEQRVYKVSCGATQRSLDIDVPEDVMVYCC